ncbi:MAG: hypothetical protein CMJ47_06000 [Planctomyces sp.]|nr:hypothetical protein [Planctomyces sp.]
MSMDLNRRAMLAATAVSFVSGRSQAAEPKAAGVGPMIGHVSSTTARIWYRPEKPGRYLLHVSAGNVDTVEKVSAIEARPENDLCVTWTIEGLRPDTRYDYHVAAQGGNVVEGSDYYFRTPAKPADQQRVCLAFGSCASMDSIPLWTQMKERGADGLVLLGDTPYIDSTNLNVAREKHRQFLSIPSLSALIRNTPTWGTWDDHDFGRNDSDGRLEGKENTRRALVEYRANPQFGDDAQGIYSKFRYGPVEVFLLDTRWFSRTEDSPVDPSKPTLLGRKQWEWLKQSLKDSTAPFKVIACGMIWDDKQNRESDDWGSYAHERQALFEFLGQEKISGVVLIGGDIHCSRLLKYKTEKLVGYPIHQLIVSPIHSGTIPSLNVAHPDLIRGSATPHVWLRLEVDSTAAPPRMKAEWVQMNDLPMWGLTLTENQLRKTRNAPTSR